jgi:hypothetical protein
MNSANEDLRHSNGSDLKIFIVLNSKPKHWCGVSVLFVREAASLLCLAAAEKRKGRFPGHFFACE